MSSIFRSVPGRIVALETNDVQSFTLEVRDDDAGPGENDGFRNTGFTTSFRMQERVSAQFQLSLDRSLFAIPFGDDVGTMSVGLVHGLLCETSRGQASVDTSQAVMSWYNRNKFQASRLSPLRITVGSMVYAGYVLGLDLHAEASEGSIIRSQLQLAAWGLT